MFFVVLDVVVRVPCMCSLDFRGDIFPCSRERKLVFVRVLRRA
jgi:hypothetical protein